MNYCINRTVRSHPCLTEKYFPLLGFKPGVSPMLSAFVADTLKSLAIQPDKLISVTRCWNKIAQFLPKVAHSVVTAVFTSKVIFFVLTQTIIVPTFAKKIANIFQIIPQYGHTGLTTFAYRSKGWGFNSSWLLNSTLIERSKENSKKTLEHFIQKNWASAKTFLFFETKLISTFLLNKLLEKNSRKSKMNILYFYDRKFFIKVFLVEEILFYQNSASSFINYTRRRIISQRWWRCKVQK